MSDKAAEPIPEQEHRSRLAGELDRLIERLRALTPGFSPPPFTPQRLISLVERSMSKLPTEVARDTVKRLRSALGGDWFDLDTWKGIWYMLNYTLQYNANLVSRRFAGEYQVDEWGFDWEFLDAMRPFLAFLYKLYWRVETTGLEQIPVEGRALLVANHSGQLPWDGVMVGAAILTVHPAQRLVRTLYADWVPRLPFLSHAFVKLGQALATEENGTRLLEQEELVAVFPEGAKGTGKLFKDRYRLARFDQAEFVKMALSTGAPIIPASVVGAEETYVSLANSRTLAHVSGLPYVPITPTFPWLGLLGLVPLPTKWYIDFGIPIEMNDYGPDAAKNLVLVAQLTDQVRNQLQEMLHDRLARRRSVFF